MSFVVTRPAQRTTTVRLVNLGGYGRGNTTKTTPTKAWKATCLFQKLLNKRITESDSVIVRGRVVRVSKYTGRGY